MTTSAGGESKQLSPPSSSSSTFPRFPDLPLELRIQIWQHALHSASNRVIPVFINHHPLLTFHSCVPVHGSFCGQHDHCPLYNPDSAQQPSSSLVSMINGYFCLGANTSDIDDAGVRELSRVCRESHQVFLSMYPETMTVYREMWYPNVESHPRRRVRCNPATDTLLVTAVPNYASGQRHPSSSLDNPEDVYQDDLEKWFPPRNTGDAFSGFRRVVEGWRRVVFGFLDEEGGRLGQVGGDGASEDALFRRFLVFFGGLEWLGLCAGEGGLTAGRGWERVEQHGSMDDNVGLGNFGGGESGILNCDGNYRDYVRGVQSGLSADDGGSGSGECCWVPMPRGFGGSWVFCSSKDVISDKNGENGEGVN